MVETGGKAPMWLTVGHAKAINTLQRSQREGRVSHAYLLVGPPQVGRMSLALDLARLLNCLEQAPPCGECSQCVRVTRGLHADVQVLAPNAEQRSNRFSIGIDAIREMQREASLRPFEGRSRVFIIDGAELLTDEAANSMLKTLEEPPSQVVLVLLASDGDALLPTIKSRCQKLELRPLATALVSKELSSRYEGNPQDIEEVARLSGGRIGWAFQAMAEPDLMERRAERLDAIETALRSGLEERFRYSGTLASRAASDRAFVRLELSLWLELWRDALFFREGLPELTTSQSRQRLLQLIADAASPAEIAQAAVAVQEAIDNLERNVNPRLALDDLMLALPRPRLEV